MYFLKIVRIFDKENCTHTEKLGASQRNVQRRREYRVEKKVKLDSLEIRKRLYSLAKHFVLLRNF